MGAEGSGFIEVVGEGVDQALVRRKVIFACHSWSQFVVKKFDEVILLDDSVDMRQASFSLINPMSALILRKIVKDSGFNCVLIDAVQSNLGSILARILREEGISVGGIVSDESHMKEVKDLGLKHVYNLQDKTLLDRVSNDIKDNKDKIFYISSLGGDMPGKILMRLPECSQMLVLGSLTKKDLVLPAAAFYF